MKWSTQQEQVFNWVQAHQFAKGALIVEAVAGSGKTTTIVEAAKLIPENQSAVFCAFNKSIADELKKRLPGNIESRTLNALGFKALIKQYGNSMKVDGYKTRNIIQEYLPEAAQQFAGDINNLVAKAKSHGMVPDGVKGVSGLYKATHERWAELMDRYQVDTEATMDDLFAWCNEVLTIGIKDTSIVDFDDQLYLVVAYNLPCFRYDWIIVDEAQDVSHVQRAMLRKHLKDNGKLVAVGDSRQAIYGFRGADSQSLNNIAKEFHAERLPLSVTYRCPQAVVDLARQYCPELTAADGAPQGVVNTLDGFDPQMFDGTDMVLCRNTAPLISTAYKLIAERVPVRVMGRDIGQGLISLIKKVGGKGVNNMDCEVLEERLNKWRERESEKARQRGQDSMLDVIEDKFNSVLAVIDASGATTGKEVMAEVEQLFESGRGVTFATVHRAKGLEAQRVFVLEPQLMPSKYARQDWQLEQEHNLMYVAYTRALSELYFITKDSIREKKVA